MSELVIYGIPGSPFVRAAQIAMEEKGASWRLEALAPGETKGEAYLKRHPWGRMPAVQHDDFSLYETQAIVRYVDQVFPGPALQPSDPRAAARMNQIIGINDWYLFPKAVAVIGFQRIVGPALMGITPDEALCAAAEPEARRCVGVLEGLLADNAFLAGDSFSLADAMVGPQLDFLAATPEGQAAMAGTRLLAWLERMQARPSFEDTLPPPMFRKAA
jgi:glutathione S-transferase